ncbi:MAG: UDP-N-acetylmuramoylalanine--D-glutamate ligase [Deltaproteobacteria bacterium RBG_16_50_11]|nr:MAG: UDP-N-acetylmuramoylalanine--D-glutamate ligase [Deltaproteobacteria bacterium RBG_16_50_11]
MDLHGKKVLVVGLARTGIATARFLKGKGSIVSTTETRPRDEMAEAVQALEGMDLRMEWGGHRTETFLRQDLIVLSPGVDLKIEPVQEALRKGIRVISEIELAYRFISVPILAVTGTNGKTTTTLLLGEMLKEDGKKVGVGGNVGEPLILFVDGGGRWEVLVVEISSFQLEAIETFRPSLSILLNITEDHLDRYARYEDYIEAKARIFSNQNSGDLSVLNRDDPIVKKLWKRVRARKIPFSLKERLPEGAFLNGEEVVLRIGPKEENYSLARTPLKGIHNVENMMAAITAARVLGCSKEAIENALNRFVGLEHRLEFVREVGGVRFYNDSKGTNVGSVVRSLQSFSEPVILIAGGKDKNGDLRPLREEIRSHVKRLILIGEAKERMERELGRLTDTAMATTLEEAVVLAHQSAKKGEVVLLSPACSSFDMFKDYKERGKVFKDAVKRL